MSVQCMEASCLTSNSRPSVPMLVHLPTYTLIHVYDCLLACLLIYKLSTHTITCSLMSSLSYIFTHFPAYIYLLTRLIPCTWALYMLTLSQAHTITHLLAHLLPLLHAYPFTCLVIYTITHLLLTHTDTITRLHDYKLT